MPLSMETLSNSRSLLAGLDAVMDEALCMIGNSLSRSGRLCRENPTTQPLSIESHSLFPACDRLTFYLID